MTGIHAMSALPRDVLGIVACYDATLPPALTHWHTALKRLGLDQERVSPLPWHMPQILKSKCPLPKKEGKELKPDGTPWTVGDTHVLYWVPAGSVNELEARVSAYGREALNAAGGRLYPNENPLQCRFFWPRARREYGDVAHEGEWILISKEVLEGSRN
jgi:hypothetical protein